MHYNIQHVICGSVHYFLQPVLFHLGDGAKKRSSRVVYIPMSTKADLLYTRS